MQKETLIFIVTLLKRFWHSKENCGHVSHDCTHSRHSGAFDDGQKFKHRLHKMGN